jgi:phosphoglycerol transferase MdoB-like AlkP superfamily enzyme
MRRPPTSKKRASLSDDAIGWIGLALGLIAAIVLDKNSPPHKWHAAIMWTFVALLCLLVFGRGKRSSWLFWLFWATCLVLHVVAMWVIFKLLLPRLILGTVYVVPLAYIESLFLLVAFYKLERMTVRRR